MDFGQQPLSPENRTLYRAPKRANQEHLFSRASRVGDFVNNEERREYGTVTRPDTARSVATSSSMCPKDETLDGHLNCS